MESLDFTARFVLVFLWLLHFGLPGLLLIAMYAFVERKIDLAGVSFGMPFFTGKQMELTISWVFLLAIALGFVFARLNTDVYSFVTYIYASCAVVVALNGTMVRLMRRFIKPHTVA